jgi:hypothetical protein
MMIGITEPPSEPEPPPEFGSKARIGVAGRRGVTVAAETCENGVRVGVMVGVCVGVLVSVGVLVGVSEGVGVADGADGVAVGVSVATSAVAVGLGVTGVGV